MKINVLEHTNMGLTGRYLLRSIQNEHFSNIGLLIRECLQNSLDAAIDKRPGGKVIVDAIIDRADTRKVNQIFTGLTSELNDLFSRETVIDFLAIKDSNTTGLTGPLYASQTSAGNYGNLRKLVYEFGQPQEDLAGGGSWGIGKTVCFRVGIGIVLYYSRIKNENGKFESRMAATIVENETDPEKSLLAKAGLSVRNKATGIAWWGKDDGEGNSTPITSQSEINSILDVFHIKPYDGDETGTCVIIPYIDPDALIANAKPENSPLNFKLDGFLRMMAQRWYFPRLRNKSFKYGPWLDFKVNGRSIKEAEVYTYFSCMQELYNAANEWLLSGDKPSNGIEVEDVNIRGGLERQRGGVIAFKKFTDADLGMRSGSNEPIPYALIGKDDEDDLTGNMPIIAYSRKAGMVINYEVLSAWTSGLPKMREGEFLLAFFQPDGDNIVKGTAMSLDEYIRKGEGADHSGWFDKEINGKVLTIVNRIIKNVPKRLGLHLIVEPETKAIPPDVRLQRQLAKAFLPPVGYGNTSSGKKSGGGKGGGTKITKNLTARMEEPKFEFDGSSVPVTLNLKAKGKKVRVYLKVHTSQLEISADQWEKDLGTTFPARINLQGTTVLLGRKKISYNKLVTSKLGSCYGIEIERPADNDKDIKLSCNIKYALKDETVSVRLLTEEVEE